MVRNTQGDTLRASIFSTDDIFTGLFANQPLGNRRVNTHNLLINGRSERRASATGRCFPGSPCLLSIPRANTQPAPRAPHPAKFCPLGELVGPENQSNCQFLWYGSNALGQSADTKFRVNFIFRLGFNSFLFAFRHMRPIPSP